MAKRELHARARALRKQGKSYNEIRAEVGVAKSTLSLWLEDLPLSEAQEKNLRKNSLRVENYRRTCSARRAAVLRGEYDKAAKKIGAITERELLIAGFFLYWGEGTKRSASNTVFTNTDPSMVRAFVQWIQLLGVKFESLRVKLHIYSDMNEQKAKRYWCEQIGFTKKQFKTTYIKQSKLSDITYKHTDYGQGTCNVMYSNRELNDFVLQGIQYVREQYAPVA